MMYEPNKPNADGTVDYTCCRCGQTILSPLRNLVRITKHRCSPIRPGQVCRFPKNAKLWVYHDGAFVKLTIRPGEVLRRRDCRKTDEGWDSTEEEWRHEGDRVVHEGANSASDCDGRHSYDFERFALLTELQVNQTWSWNGTPRAGVFTPNWQESRSAVYDQYARMSNY